MSLGKVFHPGYPEDHLPNYGLEDGPERWELGTNITQDSVRNVYLVKAKLSTWRSQSLKRCFSICSKKEPRYVMKFNA